MRSLLHALAAAAVVVGGAPCHAQPDLFKGKPLRFVLGAAAGQDYDVWARLIGRHLSRHIPSAPTVVVQNMPGAGHILATNWLYNVAPRDGTVWGMVSRNIPNAGLQGFQRVGVHRSSSMAPESHVLGLAQTTFQDPATTVAA